ncbi:MAG: protein-export chaperone SecB [Rhodospirillaceae bacterium]|nr:protein-export chaperone SecB [Rhodospirillaceae bacterium]
MYVKDFSFESPKVPEIFSTDMAPQTELNIKSVSKEVGKDAQEVALTLTVEAKDKDQVLFVVELEQAGVFIMQGYTKEEKEMLIGSYCPNALYPFAREAISDMVTRGGFPQLLLQPINFDALYAKAVQERLQEKGEQETDPLKSTH